jgi:hypothetical protein
VPIDGSEPETDYGYVGAATALTVDADNVYWASDEAIFKAPKDGSAAPAIVVDTSVQYGAGIAVDATSIYWSVYGNAIGSPGSILSAPIGGGPLSTLASNLLFPAEIALVGGTLYFNQPGDGVSPNGSVKSIPITGGAAPTVIRPALVAPQPLAADGAAVFYGYDSGHLAKSPVPSGAATELYGSSMSYVVAIAVDATSVYWVDPYLAHVVRLTPK